MSQTIITILLVIALLLPFVGALLLRVLRNILPTNVAAVLGAILAVLVVGAVLSLSSINIGSFRIGNLTLLLPVASSVNRPVDTSVEPISSEPVDGVPTDIPEVTITPEPILIETPPTDVVTPTVEIDPNVPVTDTTTLTDTTVLTDTLDPNATPEPTAASAEATAVPEPTAAPASAVATATLIPAPTEPVGLRVYAVEAGDSLGSIAEKFNVSVKQIMAVNPYLQNPDALLVGQELNIP
ncbi:MAG: LysM domain [Chloroflexota bacterium]|jgi:peptidoglycan endopeptidase LytE